MKSPDAVKQIISTGSNTKSDGIGYVFRNFKPLFANISKPKINKNSGKSDDSEFYKLPEKRPVQILVHKK